MLLGALVLLLTAGGGYVWWSRTRPPEPLLLGGNVDIREVNLAFRVGGRVSEVLAEEGDRVAAGQTLARIDPEPLRLQLAQAEAALAVAEAGEALLRAGSRAEDLARLRAQMDALEAVAANAESTFERQQRLVRANAVSEQVLDDARAARERTRGDFAAAQQAYAAAAAGARPEELQEAHARTAAAKAEVQTAALQLADATLAAPSDGTLLTRAVEPGAMAAAGATALTLSLDRPVRVRAYVEEPDLGRFPPGAPVEVLTDARPGRPYRGRVGFVSPRAEFTPKQVETQDLRTALVYRMRITVEDPDDSLRQGMPVTVRLSQGG